MKLHPSVMNPIVMASRHKPHHSPSVMEIHEFVLALLSNDISVHGAVVAEPDNSHH